MNLRGSLLLLSLLCVLCLGLALGCNKATPVAPSGTTLAISANPSRIETNGTSTITVFGQKANGSVLDSGTVIRFSTDKGTIDPTGTIKDGQATAFLRGDGTTGMATVTATAGASTMAMTKVAIGPARNPASITIQANPTSIDPAGGTVNLLAIVRDDQGQPLAGALVNFQTDVGTLVNTGGQLVPTDNNGAVTEQVRVRASDLTSNISSFMVKANAAGANGTLLSAATFTIQVKTGKPVANFTFTNLGSFKVQFVNTSTGQNLTYLWDFGDGSFSTEANPSHQYTGAGPFQVTLTATNSATGEASVKTQSVKPS